MVDIKTRKIIIVCAVITLVLFSIGVLIGYFSGKGTSTVTEVPANGGVADAIRSTCGAETMRTPSGKLYFDRYVERHSEKQACVNNPEKCWDFGLPRNYIAYHLNGRSILIDGKLDDEAWNEVHVLLYAVI